MSAVAVKKPRARRGVKSLAQQAQLDRFTPEAKRTAACVLEVLAGVRTPEQASAALGLSLPTYYQTEARALRGLVAGCSPEPPGRAMVLGKQLRSAELRAAVLEKQVQRYQALLRSTQRSIGLTPAQPGLGTKPGGASGGGGASSSGGGGRKRKPKRPSVRALRAAECLRDAAGESPPPPAPPASAASASAAALSGEVLVG